MGKPRNDQYQYKSNNGRWVYIKDKGSITKENPADGRAAGLKEDYGRKGLFGGGVLPLLLHISTPLYKT
ncbi:hypothetical protein [Butyrivibrio fibrisolvens]|jgi:hypothetical protein|uniref:hypothetical protein n=1 Tax=Butyrivibrio fibrisolvens TaxID=831 RepID=UPI000483E6CD|nr:hypothetical protein [Butyrivibrio fibrisolvens]